jgi:anti-anti-sigma regulatory factor
MTLRIVKIFDATRTVLKLCGRIQARDIEELRDQMDGRTRATILDLQEVTLVDVEVVRFLGRCEANGVELAHCSPYIREWVFREQAAGGEN